MSDRRLPVPIAPAAAPTSAPVGDAEIADVARAAIEAARAGNMYGAEIARRLWRDRRQPVRIDLPEVTDVKSVAEAQATVIAAAASGKLAPRDALDFATMLEYRRRSLETLDQEARLREIEEAQAEQAREARKRRR
ncbi:MAG TPA: hypothetical protein VMI56_25965 [Reyranella sp.]|nr:hypothetical protein [Reyranella sp.]